MEKSELALRLHSGSRFLGTHYFQDNRGCVTLIEVRALNPTNSLIPGPPVRGACNPQGGLAVGRH